MAAPSLDNLRKLNYLDDKSPLALTLKEDEDVSISLLRPDGPFFERPVDDLALAAAALCGLLGQTDAARGVDGPANSIVAMMAYHTCQREIPCEVCGHTACTNFYRNPLLKRPMILSCLALEAFYEQSPQQMKTYARRADPRKRRTLLELGLIVSVIHTDLADDGSVLRTLVDVLTTNKYSDEDSDDVVPSPPPVDLQEVLRSRFLPQSVTTVQFGALGYTIDSHIHEIDALPLETSLASYTDIRTIPRPRNFTEMLMRIAFGFKARLTITRVLLGIMKLDDPWQYDGTLSAVLAAGASDALIALRTVKKRTMRLHHAIIAAAFGSTACVHYLSAGFRFYMHRSARFGPLHAYAVSHRWHELPTQDAHCFFAETLMHAGCLPSTLDERGNSAVMLCVATPHHEDRIMRLRALLHIGVSARQTNKAGLSPMQVMDHCARDAEDVRRALLQYGASPPDFIRATSYEKLVGRAIAHTDSYSLALMHARQVRGLDEGFAASYGRYKEPAIVHAVESAEEDTSELRSIVQLLIEHGMQSPDARKGAGRHGASHEAGFESVLHVAVRRGFVKTARQLLRAGADVNAQWGVHKTAPLHVALAHVGAVRYELVRLLVQEHNADPTVCDARCRNAVSLAASAKVEDEDDADDEEEQDNAPSSSTPQPAAVVTGSSEYALTLKVLLTGCPREAVLATDDSGRTALHHACFVLRHKAVELLIQAGADADGSPDEDDATPLRMAMTRAKFASQRVAVVAALMPGAPDLERTDASGATALLVAATQTDLPLLRILLKAGADPTAVDNKGRSALHLLLQHSWRGLEAHVKTLVEGGVNPKIRDADGRMAQHLFKVTHRREWLMREFTVEHTRDTAGNIVSSARKEVDFFDDDGHAIVRHLLDAGADIDATDECCRTVLHYAARAGAVRTVQLLLERGSYAWTLDAKDYTPLEFVRQSIPAKAHTQHHVRATIRRVMVDLQVAMGLDPNDPDAPANAYATASGSVPHSASAVNRRLAFSNGRAATKAPGDDDGGDDNGRSPFSATSAPMPPLSEQHPAVVGQRRSRSPLTGAAATPDVAQKRAPQPRPRGD